MPICNIRETVESSETAEKAYSEGRDYCRVTKANVSRYYNPYPFRTDERLAYAEGWHDYFDENLRNKQAHAV